MDLGVTVRFSIADLSEDITNGQTVASYVLERDHNGKLVPISEGTTIGFRKLDRFDPVEAQRLRLTIREAVDTPRRVSLALYP
jgi:alpha-L-fucosidase